ncbi:hypothetical protein T492DRAFT_1073317 [Pavlovales sp. CCMP2436]|nr:hypothetical protein T492DRAFT_1073317 [Pavlovales sp. CCMP2436]
MLSHYLSSAFAGMARFELAARAAGAAATAFCTYKGVELLLEFPEPCELMLAQARAHPAVAERLGAEMQRSLMWTGRVTDKRAVVTIPVYGERGGANIVGRACCTQGEDGAKWDVLTLDLESPGHVPPPVSLMPEVPQASPEEMARHVAFHRSLPPMVARPPTAVR